jgi:RHS repeat-associated protein
VTADYTYDGLERMAIRTTQNMTPAGTTHYIYDTAGHLLAEASGTGTFLTEYIWLDDLPLAIEANLDTSQNLYFVHADHLNRPLRMTDASESLVWDAVYHPFGDIQSITGSASNNLRFPGQYFLLEGGLHYNWYRHYDPTIGRYAQPDSLEFDGLSNYAYVGNDPINRVDPSGRSALALPLGMGGEALGLGGLAAFCAEPVGWVVCGGAAVGGIGYSGYKFYEWITSPDCPPLLMVKTTKKSGKEKADDFPSWVREYTRDPKENCHDFAKNILNDKRGVGKWRKGAGSEYSQIVKACQRGDLL